MIMALKGLLLQIRDVRKYYLLHLPDMVRSARERERERERERKRKREKESKRERRHRV